MRRFACLLAAALAAGSLCTAVAQARSRLQIGAVVPELTVRSLVGSTIEKLTDSGLGGAGRVTLTWRRGQKNLDPGLLSDLQYAVQQAGAAGIDLYLTLYPAGPKDTPLTPRARVTFANWAASIVARLPQLRHVIVGNEPNLNTFWLPQFDRRGTDVAAPAYVLLLARTYDAVKAVSPSIEVVGGALAHMGLNRPSRLRATHAPQRFLLDMGKAYRESGRKRPIMDAFAFHPYLEHANLPPTYKHYSPRVITIADYGRLVSVLRRAFDGTGQRGSKLPIVYAEFGVESQIPVDLLNEYTGLEPWTTGAVNESVQARYYVKAMQLAACQPTVRTFLVFRLIDEPALEGWQSGLYYVDGSPKSSLPAVEAAARRLREQPPTSCKTLLAPQPRVSFFPGRRPTASVPTLRPLSLFADADGTYEVRLMKGSSLVADVRGRAVAGVRRQIGLTQTFLTPGTYRLSIRVNATDFRARPFTKSIRFTF